MDYKEGIEEPFLKFLNLKKEYAWNGICDPERIRLYWRNIESDDNYEHAPRLSDIKIIYIPG